MANNYREIDSNELIKLADEYCDFCIDSTIEVVSGSGKLVDKKERHLPTTNYFLLHWLRRNKFDFYKRSNWYTVLSSKVHPLSDTIKSIDEKFNSLAEDIVANEGKGIFYAKNKLGMTDRLQTENINHNTNILNIDPLDDSADNRIKEDSSTKETD